MPLMTAHVLLTGHSRGLGAALARLAQEQGHHVLGLSSQQLDLADAAAVQTFLQGDQFASFFARSEKAVLINNAGRLLPVGMNGSLSSREIFETVTVNVGAALALTNAFIAATQACPDRRIVQISSGAARSPYAGWSIYCATKAALDQYARGLALEGHAGLRVESLAPGIIDTDMQGQVRATALEAFPMRPKFDKLKAEGALASPDLVAQKLLTHLLSEQFGQQVCTDLRQLA
jgi:benzil reductase ((S)-benzoin forming)